MRTRERRGNGKGAGARSKRNSKHSTGRVGERRAEERNYAVRKLQALTAGDGCSSSRKAAKARLSTALARLSHALAAPDWGSPSRPPLQPCGRACAETARGLHVSRRPALRPRALFGGATSAVWPCLGREPTSSWLAGQARVAAAFVKCRPLIGQQARLTGSTRLRAPTQRRRCSPLPSSRTPPAGPVSTAKPQGRCAVRCDSRCLQRPTKSPADGLSSSPP